MSARRAISVLLALVGSVIAVLGLLVVEAEKALFDRPHVEQAIDEILQDPDINRLLTREITKRAVTLGALTEQESLVKAYVEQQVESPAVQADIRAGVLAAYDTLMDTDNPRIDFNMANQAALVRSQLVMLNPELDSTLPPSDELLRFTLFQRPTLPWGYDLVQGTRDAAWTLFIIGAAMVVLALIIGPGRIGLFAFIAGVASLSMLAVYFLTLQGGSRVIGGIDDALQRRVARLSLDEFLRNANRLAIGVMIFAGIACIAGLLAGWIRMTYFPPKPKLRRVKGVDPIPMGYAPPGGPQ